MLLLFLVNLSQSGSVHVSSISGAMVTATGAISVFVTDVQLACRLFIVCVNFLISPLSLCRLYLISVFIQPIAI